MTFEVRSEKRPNSLGLDDRVFVLGDGQESFVEIAPAIGFNAYRWHVPQGELLYADPKFFEEHKPTRSGFPILFPFPNRIRDGKFTWEGKSYRLPTNDSSGKNAIHGFVCQRPWRGLDHGADAKSAWVSGEFVGSRDAPQTLNSWPADYRIKAAYRLEANSLEVQAEVSTPGNKDLPWGLGYHPYFDLSVFGGPDAIVTVSAASSWELADNLPTGRQAPMNENHDLRQGQRYGDLRLDDVFTKLDRSQESDHLALVGKVSHGRRNLELWASSFFREMVGFTPPHRQAVCLEPYTCTTDAINLEQKGIDAGLRVLKPGETITGRIKVKFV